MATRRDRTARRRQRAQPLWRTMAVQRRLVANGEDARGDGSKAVGD